MQRRRCGLCNQSGGVFLAKKGQPMPLSKYGVLKGTVTGHLRNADDDHYQILVKAGNTVHRIAVNVKSSAPKAPSTLLFLALTSLPAAYVKKLDVAAVGYTKLASKADGLALDYVRNGWFKPKAMKQVPPDAPGVDNDLKDKLEDAVVKAIDQAGSLIYAFGEKWGPEKKKKDQYFKFVPGNGIHDIHMNQGNSGRYKQDNGVYQDGGLVFQYPGGKRLAFFFSFQSQTFDTDNKGNPRGGGRAAPVARKAAKRRGSSRKRRSTKKAVKKRRL
jgi:uncharacterized protein YukJ